MYNSTMAHLGHHSGLIQNLSIFPFKRLSSLPLTGLLRSLGPASNAEPNDSLGQSTQQVKERLFGSK